MSYKHFCNDVIKTFFQEQDQDFKILSRPLQDQAYSVQDQDQDFASQDQDQDLFVMYSRGWPKSIFFIFGLKRKCRQNEIPFTAENEMKTKIDIKRSPDNISVFFFFS